jgi:hypothetical protein
MRTSFHLSFLSVVLIFMAMKLSAQTFTRGHYTDLNNQYYQGQISYKIGQDYFHYRENRQEKEMKLKPGEVQSFVWGIDSFVVIQESFARVIIPEGPVRLYRNDKTGRRSGRNPIVGKVQPGFSFLQRTFIVERPESGEILVLENKKEKKFVAQIRNFFADAPELVQRVEKGEFGPGDIRNLVQIYNEEYGAKEPQEPKN